MTSNSDEQGWLDRDVYILKESDKLMAEHYSNPLFTKLSDAQRPIVYCDSYNINFFYLEKLHPFDTNKWGNVYKLLLASGRLLPESIVEPEEMKYDDLREVHSKQYLKSLRRPCVVARIVEVAPLSIIPYCIYDSRLLRPMRFQTTGSILAADLALQHGWAINLGGGFHHASATRGGGFCVYADITLALHFLFLRRKIMKAMIIDLDAHQGNGHERDFREDSRVFIFDMFNSTIYPHDYTARSSVRRPILLSSGVSGAEYLQKLNRELEPSLEDFVPDIIVYNAGTDCLSNDPLGRMDLSPDDIIKRDEMVFTAAKKRNIPIVMLTSGGYLHESAKVIADSILNLDAKRLIVLDPFLPTETSE